MSGPQYIKDIMSAGVISIATDDTVQRGVDLMADRNISCVIVTDAKDNNRPVGIITERDMVQRVLKERRDPKKTKAEEVMTPSIITISEDASFEDGLHMIEQMKIRRLAVVRGAQLVGLVTFTDIVKHTNLIHQHNKKLTFHQNLQSYVIIGLFAILIVILLIRMFVL